MNTNTKLISFNPATEEIVWTGHSASHSEIATVISIAKKTQHTWAALSLEKRIDYLLAFQKILQESKESFALTISRETGKPLWESKSEIDAMIGKVDISIEAQTQRCKYFTKDLLHTRHKPLGVCAVLGPFNFPGHLPNGHIIPALLAGNTVVFKPSELTPLVAVEMVKLWKKANLPEGVISLIFGGAREGRLLSSHPDINAVFFTGSWATGKILAEQFGAHPDKLLALEMGGNNPLVIGDISNPKAAAFLTLQSAFATSGQRCTCARRLIVPRSERGAQVIEQLLKWIPQIRIGSFNQTPEPFMGPLISNRAADTLLKTQQLLIEKGAIPLASMERIKSGTPFLSPGILDVTEIKELPDEEYFGPLLQLIQVKNFEEAIQEANHTHFGLVAGLLSESKTQYETFYREVKAGVINWNTPTTGASSHAPFGGVKRSGNFRPSAFYAADYCNYPVASMESSTLAMPSKIPYGLDEVR